MLPIGHVLRNNYHIVSYIASGGFGNTYLAQSGQTGVKVALKEFFMKGINQYDADMNVVVPDEKDRPVFLSQKNKFAREAQILACLNNNHIVRIFDSFEENGTAYYVMEFIDGVTLSQYVKQNGRPLRQQEAQAIFIQLLDALYAIHQKGILHLDVKPANVMIDSGGTAKIIDFGTSKIQNASTDTIATYTPSYAPMELQSQRMDALGPWTDIYSLGATYYFMLTAQKPPQETDIVDHGDNAFNFSGDTPPATARLVRWMMQPVRRNRPQTVTQVLAALDNGQIPVVSFDDDFTQISRETPDNDNLDNTVIGVTGASVTRPNEHSVYHSQSSHKDDWQTNPVNRHDDVVKPTDSQRKKSSGWGCFWTFFVTLLLLAGAAFYLYQQGYFDRYLQRRPQVETSVAEDESQPDETLFLRQQEMDMYDKLTELIDRTKQKVRDSEYPQVLEVVLENFSQQWNRIEEEYEGVDLTENHTKIIQTLYEGMTELAQEKYAEWKAEEERQRELENQLWKENETEDIFDEEYEDDDYVDADSVAVETIPQE